MKPQLDFLPHVSVTLESHSILSVEVVVFPSWFIEHDGLLPSFDEPYPLLHFTAQYPVKDTSPAPSRHYRLFSPNQGRPYWHHTVKVGIPTNRVQQLLRVTFWRDSLPTWQRVGSRDLVVPAGLVVRSAGGLFLFVQHWANNFPVSKRQHQMDDPRTV